MSLRAERDRLLDEKSLRQKGKLKVQIHWTASPAGVIQDFNQHWLQWTGLTSEQVLSQGLFAGSHPDDLASMQAAWAHSLETGEPYHLQHRVRRADGVFQWVCTRVFPHRSSEGALLGWSGFTEDIEDHVKAEHELRRTQEVLQAIINNAPTAILMAGSNGEFLLHNRASEQLLGGPPTGTGKAPQGRYTVQRLDGSVFPPDELPLVKALRGEECSDVELVICREDGKRVVGLAGASPLRDEAGKIWAAVATVQDITKLKEVEAALRISEEQFRAMFNIPSVGKAQIDLATDKFVRVNSKFCEITGYSESELMELSPPDLTHPDDLKTWNEPGDRELGGNCDYETEKRYIRRDGKVVWVHVCANMIRNDAGRPLLTAAIIQDITERRRTEQALAESEERRRLAESVAQIGIYEYSPMTREFHLDARMSELCGLGAEQKIGLNSFLDCIHPEDKVAVLMAVRSALNPGSSGSFYVEHRLSGTTPPRWMAGSGRVTFTEGIPVRLIGTMQDITRQKGFEAELERLVDERTRMLNELVDELEHFSYSITHDMRAPLRAMRGFAEMIQERLPQATEPDIQRFLQQISASAERMDLLITDALNYSRTARQELPLTSVDLGRLLNGLLEAYPQFMANRSRIHIEGDLPLVIGNEAGLIQCFSNLIGNALKFVPEGKEAKIRVWSEPLTRKGPEDGEEAWVRIWVEDNGIGISEVMRPHVFDMFSRGSATYEGTGIGLALVRKVIHRMGGRVGVESEEGVGSRFWVELKAAVPVA